MSDNKLVKSILDATLSLALSLVLVGLSKKQPKKTSQRIPVQIS